MPNPNNAGDRSKASRYRKALAKGEQLADVDKLWLAEYEEKAQRTRTNSTRDYGHSRSGRTVKFEMQEAAEAEGTGVAAAAAAAALAAKEEGRRLDYLATTGHESMKQACEEWRSMCRELRVRQRNFDQVHIELLTAWREHFIARTNAESALVQQQESGDPANQMLLMVIAKHLGIDMAGLPAMMAPPQAKPRQPPQPPQQGPQQQRPQRRPPPNGV